MPFTPAHVAAVLPFASSARLRRVLDPWALAAGAMVPDLPLFIPFLPEYISWHDARGVLTYGVVSVVILLGLLQQVFWEPLVSLLPPAFAARAAGLRPSFRPLPVVAGAIVGGLTHVFWDSFTHERSLSIWGWSWLGEPVYGSVRMYGLLQYLSSVAGLALILWWSRRGLLRLAPETLPARLAAGARTRLTVFAACAAGIVAGALVWPLIKVPDPALGLRAWVTKAGAGTVIGLAAVLAVHAAVWHWQYSRRAGVRD
ncbi:DUF4184 family protein [Nonomuraea sp. NPDC050310]|uniref:DUF4184 family protein n=1 Tax=unclassified Nonomuraea TaxID=2593643 RepID=UPI0033D33512